jgi:maltose alpha-D-glucosyltransferase/alpha-amylase
MKLFLRLEEGENPEGEMVRALRSVRFAHAPEVLATLAYQDAKAQSSLALVQAFVPNQGDAWTLTLDAVRLFFEHASAIALDANEVHIPPPDLIAAVGQRPPLQILGATATYVDQVARLGERTAELHAALGRIEGSAFAPEALTELYQRSLYQSARTRLNQTFARLRDRAQLQRVAPTLRSRISAIGSRTAEVDARLRRIMEHKVTAQRIRIHGDLHLGQILVQGSDFVFIDFEGEPARSVNERRFKRSPVVDVAGMLRSFQYAAAAVMQSSVRAEDHHTLGPWALGWPRWMGATFLDSYLATTHASGQQLVPADVQQIRVLLDFYLLDKCIYELGYELDHRPDWLAIPLRGIEELLDTP